MKGLPNRYKDSDIYHLKQDEISRHKYSENYLSGIKPLTDAQTIISSINSIGGDVTLYNKENQLGNMRKKNMSNIFYKITRPKDFSKKKIKIWKI